MNELVCYFYFLIMLYFRRSINVNATHKVRRQNLILPELKPILDD